MDFERSINVGANWMSWWGGLPRVCFSFFAGVGLFRMHHVGIFKLKLNPLPLLAFTTALLIIPGILFGGKCDLILVFIGFPAVILIGANCRSGKLSRAFDWLGRLSYPIYVLQSGVIGHIQALAGEPARSEAMSVAILASGIVAYAIFCWGALHFFDEPIRAYLLKRGKNPVRPVGETAP